MNKRKLVIGAISAVVFIAMLITILSYLGELAETKEYFLSMRPEILLLLVPNIVLMYYAAGRIWYPYLNVCGLTPVELGAIQYELNFVNTVVPSASLSGLVYATERLRQYNVKSGYAGGLYLYRYIVSITTNWIGILGAIVILLLTGRLRDLPLAPMIFLAVLVFVMVLAFVILALLLTGKVHVKEPHIERYLSELHLALALVTLDRRGLISSWSWGMLYTVLEDTPFLIVAWAMGHPELFLPTVVAAAAGIIVGSIIPTPSGIGGFDGAMIYLLGSLGTGIALASAVTVTGHLLVVVLTVITGYPFWQRGMLAIGRSRAS